MHCRKQGKFNNEMHMCFIQGCNNIFYPGKNETCPKCNYKKCDNGHCACNVSPETKEKLDKFYDLFCEPHDYSEETKYALFIMLNTFNNNCSGCLISKK